MRKGRPFAKFPQGSHVVAFRPRGLDLRSMSENMLYKMLATAVATLSSTSSAEPSDVLRINRRNNTFAVATMSADRAECLCKVTSIDVGGKHYSVLGYLPVPAGATKIVLRRAYTDESPKQVEDLVIGQNPEHPIISARRIGKTTAILVVLEPGAQMPVQLRYGHAIIPCEEYRERYPVCLKCRKIGHRADICVATGIKNCSVCGAQHPPYKEGEEPKCRPKCIVCSGPHYAGSRDCKFRYVPPRQTQTRNTTNYSTTNQSNTNAKGRTSALTSTEKTFRSTAPRGRSRSCDKSRSNSRSRSLSRRRPGQERPLESSRNQRSNGQEDFPPLQPGQRSSSSKNVSWPFNSSEDSSLKAENAKQKLIIESMQKEIRELRINLRQLATERAISAHSGARTQVKRPLEHTQENEPPTRKVAIQNQDKNSQENPLDDKYITKDDFQTFLTGYNQNMQCLNGAIGALTQQFSTLDTFIGRMTAIEPILDKIISNHASTTE